MNNKNAENNSFNRIKSSKKRLVFVFLFLIIIGLIILTSSKENFAITSVKKLFSGNTPISKVEIQTEDYDNEGSIKLTKEAHWINKTEAELDLSLETIRKTGDNKKDIVLVFDVSGSMEGEKLDKVKQDAGELIEYVLEKDEDNKIGLITFASESRIISPLTNNKEELLEAINNMSTEDATNYYLAYKDIETILDGYSKESGKDLVVLFMTDGVPTDGSSAQGVYESLKEQYPYITINAVEYEKGKTASDTISISDNQWVANMDTFNNVLFEATVSPEVYEKLRIDDYIEDEYFEIETNTPSKGSVSVDNNKITWRFTNNSYTTGSEETLKVRLKLKEQYQNIKGLYPTNKKTEIEYKIDNTKEKTSTLTPILKNNYDVIYDMNSPETCNLEDPESENHFIYDAVTIKDIEPKCTGYTFKGWKTEETNIKYKSEDTFVMPEEDVHIKAIWSKQTMKAYMDGTVHEKTTLYKELASQAEKYDYLKEYTGKHQDSFDGSGNEKIYHFYANSNDTNPVALERNNVIFGGFCWQILRTTDTGGIKLIYYGIPNNDKCNVDQNKTTITDSAYNPNTASVAYGGYMYNKVYDSIWRDMVIKTTLFNRFTINKSQYYSSEYSYGSNKYKLSDDLNTNNDERITAEQCINEGNCNETLMGMYTFSSSNPDYSNSTIRYIVGVSGEYVYYMDIKNGQSLSEINKMFFVGDSFIKNDDGTYTVTSNSNNLVEYNMESWFSNYSNSNNKYICIENNPCNNLIYITSSDIQSYNYETVVNNYLYGNDFDYILNESTGEYEYILKDTDISSKIQFWDWNQNYNNINNNHYTCFNDTGKCNRLYYIHNNTNTRTRYIILEDGTNINDAIVEMTSSEDLNKTNSTIKNTIDTWYGNNMTNYTKYLEDTIFCNHRKIYNLGGWNPNGGINSNSYPIRFQPDIYHSNNDLFCYNETDKFCKANAKAKLQYPIGLPSSAELQLLNNNLIRKSGKYYWAMNPAYFYQNDQMRIYTIEESGVFHFYSKQHGGTAGVRPVISLKPEIEYTEGDGSKNNPYIIDTTE